MNVLMIGLDFLPNVGGIAAFLHNLCAQLCRQGHWVDVLTPAREGCAKADNGQPYCVYRYVSPQRLSSIVPIRRTLALHRQHHYDVVFIGHFTTTHALGALALRWLWSVPYVILSHGNDLTYSIHTRTDEIVARWLLHNAALMLGNSRFTVELVRQAGYQGSAEVLNPGVDPARFHPGVDTTKVRQKHGLDGHRVMLTVARLVAKKNVDGVLRALPKVIGQVPDVLYLVAGDGEERKQLEALCDELRLRPYVRFLGYTENSLLPALYCASDVFVIPTKGVESFGISFVEANACGIPVIAGRSGGTADAVIDGETGLLVDPHDVDALAEAMIKVLTDEEYAKMLGTNGRRRVEQEFDWQLVGERLERILEDLIERHPHKSSASVAICPLCGAPDVHPAGNARYWLKRRHIMTAIDYCRSCDLFFRTFDLPAEQIVAHFEDASYTSLENEAASRQVRHPLFTTVLQRLPRSTAHPRILDVGCGYGHFLDLCHAEGWEAHGLEISRILYQHLLSRKPYRVTQAPIQQAQLPDEFFDIITFIDSLYYVDDPILALATAYRKLKPGATLLLRVTNRNAYIKLYLAYLRSKRLLFRNDSSDVPEWLVGDGTWMFSRRCLERLLELTGFTGMKFHYWEREKVKQGMAVRILYLLTSAVAQMSFGAISLTPGLIVTAEKAEQI